MECLREIHGIPYEINKNPMECRMKSMEKSTKARCKITWFPGKINGCPYETHGEQIDFLVKSMECLVSPYGKQIGFLEKSMERLV